MALNLRVSAALAVSAVVCASSAFALENQATNLSKGTPYYYTGYYQYGNSPYVTVPNFALSSSGPSYLFSPYYYGYNSSAFYGTPNVKRAWSLGYLSNGHTGAYYY